MGGIRCEGLEKRGASEGDEGAKVKGKEEKAEEGGRGVRQRAAEALSDPDRDTFAPELWNCVV